MTNCAIMKITKLLSNDDGNFTMMAALMLPILFAAGTLAVDATNAFSMKTRLQNAADSAALGHHQPACPGKDHSKSLRPTPTLKMPFSTGRSADDATVRSIGILGRPRPSPGHPRPEPASKTVWHGQGCRRRARSELTGLARIVGKETLDVDRQQRPPQSARDGIQPAVHDAGA
jgi:hypothetical protein